MTDLHAKPDLVFPPTRPARTPFVSAGFAVTGIVRDLALALEEKAATPGLSPLQRTALIAQAKGARAEAARQAAQRRTPDPAVRGVYPRTPGAGRHD